MRIRAIADHGFPSYPSGNPLKYLHHDQVVSNIKLVSPTEYFRLLTIISIHVKENSSYIPGSINIAIPAGPAVVIVATLDRPESRLNQFIITQRAKLARSKLRN
jgi:hypothetical protein